jgi:hypothetical protein
LNVVAVLLISWSVTELPAGAIAWICCVTGHAAASRDEPARSRFEPVAGTAFVPLIWRAAVP